ncbi:mitochondrial carrier family [Plasmopara halstedii]|uniref:Mitochondrial carrier family n=1 Tax=Plasmopara halstedii TaxID=4781 RepID=A0A0P1A5F2_PLAHL|nr:mitochondrial carrier family [Plasmopara halstedii]CEG35322.1 mitochondrial carrier family [Plasmopara halstedii]|eukprot:XP_024571691.1 mitochondrial carrier family [Plasmopara halstedii]
MDSPTFKALVDASAGAMGALFAAVLLYPLDVVKTRIQVDVDNIKEEESEELKEKTMKLREKSARSMLVFAWFIYRQEGFEGLFAGLSSKIVHTVLSNFAYFYWYSFLISAVEKHFKLPTTTGMSLLVASTAGALNMSLTLPLEMINTRAQIEFSGDKDETNGPRQRTLIGIAREIYAENGLRTFWKGFIPSLVLVSNPSINYTIFYKLKLQLQQFKMAANNTKRVSSLTALEALILAAFAKAVATIITYPIIRAKVLIQAQTKPGDGRQQQLYGHHQPEKCSSMLHMLKRINELEGFAGYFKGCSAQLFITVLKSALLVMTKEQIAKYTTRILCALHRNTRQTAIEAAKA